MELVNEKIGKETGLTLTIVNGNLVLSVKTDTSGVDAEVKATISADYFLDLLAAKIPGQIDDAVLALIKQALKAV